MPKRLTARQRKIRFFVLAYVRDFNGARSAIAAGYSERRAAAAASELLDDEEVQGELARVMRECEERSGVRAFKVLEELVVVGFVPRRGYPIS